MSSVSNNIENKSIKIALIGDGGVGKTSLIRRHRTGEFDPKYRATMGVEVSRLKLYTNLPELQIWDTAGLEAYGGLREGYYLGAQAAIFMFDVTAPSTYKSLVGKIQEFRKVCPKAPFVICGNKVDTKERKVRPRDIVLHSRLGCPYFDISAKSNYNFEKPFAKLYKLLGYDQKPIVNEHMMNEIVNESPKPINDSKYEFTTLRDLLTEIAVVLEDATPEVIKQLRANPTEFIGLLNEPRFDDE